MALRVLILGGYGVFGARLARLVAGAPGLGLMIAGRSRAKAEALCATLEGAEPAVFDRDLPIEPQLRGLAPELVIDAMGPFQDYGDDPYAVIRAALALGIDYMDFADGADFVRGVAQFNAEAKALGVFVLSGVSSFPVLTAAAARRLGQGIDQVETIAGGIAPSPYAGVGLNVIRAVSAYAGKPVKHLQDGRPVTSWGLIDNRRYVIAPPGCSPLDPVRFSLVDVPDLQMLPREWPGLRSIWMGAGPVPGVLHRGLNAFAWAVRLRALPSLAPFARLFHWAINHLRWGEHRGGMCVEVSGRTSDGTAVTRSWHLLAEGDDGPLIPAMALEALIRRMLAGERPEPGARAAMRELELADYQPLFDRFAITTGLREEAAPDAPLYRRILGAAFDELPEPVRRMHEVHESLVAEGRAEVTRGGNPLARGIAALFRFPKAGRDVPVRVSFTVEDGVERWERNFDDRKLVSWQSAGKGPCRHLMAERFGPFVFGLALVVEPGRLRLVPRRWTAFGVPMPRFLMPRGESFETVEDGKFRFHVEIRLPLLGLMVRYRGWLAPVASPSRP
ncbi:MAG: DUF4166 domain-containing protein [Paracoccaceae bacterium]|nr:DUF4166 domain-containing protein [Paracoccaceae bacterium]